MAGARPRQGVRFPGQPPSPLTSPVFPKQNIQLLPVPGLCCPCALTSLPACCPGFSQYLVTCCHLTGEWSRKQGKGMRGSRGEMGAADRER